MRRLAGMVGGKGGSLHDGCGLCRMCRVRGIERGQLGMARFLNLAMVISLEM